MRAPPINSFHSMNPLPVSHRQKKNPPIHKKNRKLKQNRQTNVSTSSGVSLLEYEEQPLPKGGQPSKEEQDPIPLVNDEEMHREIERNESTIPPAEL